MKMNFKRKKGPKPTPGWSGEDVARLDSSLREIVEALFGPGREDASGDWRYKPNDSFVLHRNGFWFDFVAHSGAFGALTFLERNIEAGHAFARKWLAEHAGDGSFGRHDGIGDDNSEEVQSLLDREAEAYLEELWVRAKPVTDSPTATTYAAGRGLDVAAAGADSQLRWLDKWRGDEGVILAHVCDNVGQTVALQLTHIKPDGTKSDTQPVRKLLKGPHDWRRRGAFRLGSGGATTLTMVEGVEDAIAAALAGAERVHAVLGAGGIGRAELPPTVTDVVLARDDDPPGSPASLQLGRGVARVLLQGRRVKITARAGTLAEGAKDIADLWRIDSELARKMLGDAGFLKDQLDAAQKNELLDQVSFASTDTYENTRHAVAEALGWRASALDAERTKRVQARAKQGSDPVIRNIQAEPWPHPVTDLGAVLDEAVKQTKRFTVAPDWYHDVKALWAAHTPLVFREELGVEYSPRLAFQSPREKCGKSTALKCVLLMSHNPIPAASLTPSSVFRAVETLQISIMVEEGDNVFKNANPELLAVMNAGADRMLARVMRTEKTDDGRFEPREFSCFAPVAYTSIKRVVKTLQDRSIVLRMKRATKDERPEKLTVKTRGGLIDIGRQFARWAADLKEMPAPKIPSDLYNRIEDRWFVLFQIADLAGGDWPERCRKAALADFASEEADVDDGGPDGDLLRDVWEVFHAKQKPALFTADIRAELITLGESPWVTANHGQAINDNYLRVHLRDFLAVDAETLAPRKWREGNTQARGFHQLHFKEAFERYLGKGLPCPGPSKEASQPSQGNSEDNKLTNSNSCTGAADPDAAAPAVPPAVPPDTPPFGGTAGADFGTAGSGPDGPENNEDDQGLNGEKGSGTAGTPPSKPRGAQGRRKRRKHP
jgi:putative DNA primase/helicase